MKELFSSERLYFREFAIEDAEKLFLLNSDPEVIRYTGDAAFEDIKAAEVFIQAYDHYRLHGFGRWAVIRRSDDRFIGWCGLKFNEDDEIDIGFRFFREEWGKGYAGEAAQATLHYADQGLKIARIVGRAMPENIASVKVLEKLGFVFQEKRACHGMAGAHYFIYQPKE
jgi:RimJ/RimL family protein N-acetyltransferase